MDFVGIEKLSLVDYDGKISCILFAKGCNFLCPFCHNSELVLGKINSFIPFEDILNYLKSRKNVLDAVVISGGEPTLMDDLKGKIIQIKKLGFLIKLDTNGTRFEVLQDLINSNLVDYVAMDVKNDLNSYLMTINKNDFDLTDVIKSINLLLENRVDYEFRTTLVKEFHNEESIINMAKMLKGAKRIYLQKFISSENCFNKNLHPIEKEVSLHYVKILSNYIDQVELRGY